MGILLTITEAPTETITPTDTITETPVTINKACITPSNAVLFSQTDRAKVYGVGDSNDVSNGAEAIAKAVETDNAYLANTFGRKPDEFSFTSYVDSNIIGDRAYHCGCNSTTFFVKADAYSAGGNAAEMVEVYEAAINNGWDCDHTNGEALSRALAIVLHPDLGSIALANDAVGWWNKGAIDYISTNNATDKNQDANGCGTLFLFYLHDELGYSWSTKSPEEPGIVDAGGYTLAETYSKLTGKPPSEAFPNFKKALQPFNDAGELVPPEIGKPWTSQKPWKPNQIVEIACGVGGGVGALFLLVAAVEYYKKKRRDAAQSQPTGTIV